MSSKIQAVRKHCIECVGTQSMSEVEHCGGELIHNTGKPCPLFPYRFGKGRVPLRLIRRECLDCNGGPKGVSECQSEDCNLFPYRFGKLPSFKMSASERERRAKQMLKNSGLAA